MLQSERAAIRRRIENVGQFNVEVRNAVVSAGPTGEAAAWDLRKTRCVEELDEWARARTPEERLDAAVDLAYVAIGGLLCDAGLTIDEVYDVLVTNGAASNGYQTTLFDQKNYVGRAFTVAARINEAGRKLADRIDDLAFLHGWAEGIAERDSLPFGVHWDDVHRANMTKRRGASAHGESDAVKPATFVPPDATWLKYLSPALVTALKTRAQRDTEYNQGGVSVTDYFPFGAASYAQMLHVKCLRITSHVKRGVGMENGSLRDSVEDLLNYATFALEACDAAVAAGGTDV